MSFYFALFGRALVQLLPPFCQGLLNLVVLRELRFFLEVVLKLLVKVVLILRFLESRHLRAACMRLVLFYCKGSCDLFDDLELLPLLTLSRNPVKNVFLLQHFQGPLSFLTVLTDLLNLKELVPHLLFFLLSFSLQPLFSFYLLLLQLLGLIRVKVFNLDVSGVRMGSHLTVYLPKDIRLLSFLVLLKQRRLNV